MATKVAPIGSFGKMHTSGIYSDMTVDGPNIGTLVVIMDRAKNLPNRRSMGKQDPYCAARLGKEAKKTNTDKRGGQTPRWDQELRFTVHDSPDYRNLKVSVFNDDKKTELIGETWVNLDAVVVQGGGQSDGWHGLNCKGKYAGEIRIEITYYDSRPKAEKAAAEKRRECARPDNGAPAIGGPRESNPVKRRPLPAGPPGASSSPAATPEHRGLSGIQAGPRAYGTPPQPRHAEHAPANQGRRPQHESQTPRRPLPEGSPLHGTPASAHHTPQNQQRPPQPVPDPYESSPQPPQPGYSVPQQNANGYDTPYTTGGAYEVQPANPIPHHPRDQVQRAATHDPYRASQSHLPEHVELQHSYSAPIVPTQHSEVNPHAYASEPAYANSQNAYQDPSLHVQSLRPSPSQDPYQDPAFRVEPLRTRRSQDRGLAQPPYSSHVSNGYIDSPSTTDPRGLHGRHPLMLQPTVEDEDQDVPPPPPMHRSNATTIAQPPQERPPSYHSEAPSPLTMTGYREEPPSHQYDSPPQPYHASEYASRSPADRRYTHPQPGSRPVSRDVMVPSPLRSEISTLPPSLIAGIDPSRLEERSLVRAEPQQPDVYQSPPSYDTPPRLRQYSEPNYGTPPQYEASPQPTPYSHNQVSPVPDATQYYPHAALEEPRHRSPVQESLPLARPRAVSPGAPRSSVDYRTSRTNLRSMPTRKSVSPRPPPSADSERRLSSVPFDPDGFDVYNPTVAKKKSFMEDTDDKLEVNEKGQVVTFSGRVIDASDHLPLDSWAPEPEPKGTVKHRPVRERAVLSGARDLEAARQREREYRRDRVERERIRNAVDSILPDTSSPSTALVSSRHHYSSSTASPVASGALVLHDTESTSPASAGRNRLQKRNQRPVSTYAAPVSSSPSNIPMPHSDVLRERDNLPAYGSARYGAGARHSIAAPPIPAKLPLESENPPSEDMMALSMELQSIDIGPGSGGRLRGSARQRYGGC
ncbi:hypothetical protein M011DRAFT_409923 [Sporormia fimetaria CBS 119925]|uniref:C2 domain-containing protein n=1 Tax=Sporormia fimetaria CBS 119925 TaxID=1340428 RepID=A0A6A6V176_9PLEO|nr:hypothetical protein M011DRAFT_409923 [Sporormia fimetaria CBS 119925]